MKKSLKKVTAFLLITALMIPSASSIGITKAADTGDSTVLVDENFEGTSFNEAIQGRGATIKVTKQSDTNHELTISERTSDWNGIQIPVSAQTVEVSMKVRSANTECVLGIQYVPSGSKDTKYDWIKNMATTKDSYVEISGTYNVPAGASEVKLYLQGNGKVNLENIMVDDIKVTSPKAKPKVKKIQENLKPLKTHIASASTINGMMGVAVFANALEDATLMKLVTKHFSSITCENEMKPESFLGATPTLDKSGNPILNFANADKIMDYILAYNKANPNDIIRVRGHVLLWHSQTPSWFFKEKYSENGAYVSKEVMLQRMDYYFKQVIEHYDGSGSKYAGIISAWDVVNEQIDNGGIRVSDGGAGTSNWYQVFKGDNTYIKEAFRLANKYAPASVKLFYNDYGETDKSKTNAICNLIKEIKAYQGTRIDGMGMQGHYNMITPSVEDFEKAVRAYSKVVGEIQITELDMQSSTDYDGSNKEAEYTKQAYRYKELFDKMYELDKEKGINISSVTMWGIYDGASWLHSTSAVGGGADGTRQQCPLLFDDDYQAKPAYYGIVDPSKLEPFTKNAVALYSAKDNWTIAPLIAYTGKDTNVTFQTIWSNKNLKVKVTVTDKTVSRNDKVVVYLDTTNSKTKSKNIKQYELTRAKAMATKTGYTGVITIPVKDIKVGTVMGFDIAVTNNNVTASWNDLNNTQKVTSKYYAELTMKPYAELNYGTPKIDGKLDNVWKLQSTLPLTIKTGSPQATAKVRAMWDDKYLYVYAEVTDKKLSKANSNAWEQDSIEIFIDQNNGKTSSYEADDCQYRINYKNEASFNGTKCNATNLKSVTKLTKNGYIIETAIRLTDIKPKNGTIIGIDFQINDDAGSGSRAGTYNWYDKTGTGYANPSVFGTVTLTKK